MIRGRTFWGAFLLLMGGLLLLNNLGLLPIDVGQIFWPLVIILIGLWVLVRGRLWRGELPVEEVTIPIGEAKQAVLRLRHGAGRIEIGSGAAAGDLLSGSFVGRVSQHRRDHAGTAEVNLSLPGDSWMDFPLGARGGFEWNLHLTEELPIELIVEAGAGELDFDLRSLQVSRLLLKTGASSSYIRLPGGVDHCQVKLEAGAASVRLEVPEDVAARVTSEMGLADLKVDPSRFSQLGKSYQTANFDEADRRLEIKVEAGVSSVEVF